VRAIKAGRHRRKKLDDSDQAAAKANGYSNGGTQAKESRCVGPNTRIVVGIVAEDNAAGLKTLARKFRVDLKARTQGRNMTGTCQAVQTAGIPDREKRTTRAQRRTDLFESRENHADGWLIAGVAELAFRSGHLLNYPL
jgi:hypothetical protein